MEFQGKVWKEGKFWLIEVPALDVMTQGKTREEALFMIKDAIEELVHSYFKEEVLKGFKINVVSYGRKEIGITANDIKLFLALSLRRQRELSGSTIQETAKRLGSKSPNSYAQYERGSINVTIEKYEELLEAANPTGSIKFRLA